MARELPGKFLVRKSGKSLMVVRIVEVEAYLGSGDPASHAFRGRTARNDVMFREGGLLYVYFTYGMHYCCNVVTEEEGKGMAVLIRAGEPIAGLRLMRQRRGTSVPTLLCSGPARLCQALGIGRRENGIDLCGDEIWIAGQRDAAASGTGRPIPGSRKARMPDKVVSGKSRRPGRSAEPGMPGEPEILGDSRISGSSGRPGGPTARQGVPNGARVSLGRSTRVGIREGTEHRWRFYVKGNPHVSKGRPSGPDGAKSLR